MWDDNSPRSGRRPPRDPRQGSAPRWSQPSEAPSRPRSNDPVPRLNEDDPFRPYGRGANPRPALPQRASDGRDRPDRALVPAAPLDDDNLWGASALYTGALHTMYTAAIETPPEKHRLGIAIFHDGNPGHVWRGQVASILGEAILMPGVVMWLVGVTGSPQAVTLALLALGLPFLLFGPFAASLENIAEPSFLLKWLGRLRILLTGALIVLSIRESLYLIFAALFLISCCGRLQDALRVAATRVCLAPNEPEHVANDVQVGRAISAVMGPLFATLFFILLGESLILVSIGAAVAFLISVNSETFLDALPPERRAFLLVTPTTAYPEGEAPNSPDTSSDDDAPEDETDPPEDEETPQLQRERNLPEWYQQGPKHPGHAIADLSAGLALAGDSSGGAVALWGLCLLALVGGGLSTLEAFFITDVLGLPPFYLGPLLATLATGMAFASSFWGNPTRSGRWRVVFFTGLIGSGLALMALPLSTLLPFALVIVLVLGVSNALAALGARQALYATFPGPERRAITATQTWLTTLFSLIGVLLFGFSAAGGPFVAVPLNLPSWPPGEVIYLAGFSLLIAAAVFGVLMPLIAKLKINRATRAAKSSAESQELPATGALEEWDEDSNLSGEWDGLDRGADADDYDSRYASSYDSRYASSYGYAATGYDEAADPADDDNDDMDDYEDDQDDDDDQNDAPRGQFARFPPLRRPPPRH